MARALLSGGYLADVQHLALSCRAPFEVAQHTPGFREAPVALDGEGCTMLTPELSLCSQDGFQVTAHRLTAPPRLQANAVPMTPRDQLCSSTSKEATPSSLHPGRSICSEASMRLRGSA